MNRLVYLYHISDINGNIRYVGITLNPQRRFGRHLRDRNTTHVSRWITKEIEIGNKPIFTVFQQVTEKTQNDAEVYWITYFKSIGCNLTNITKGGSATDRPPTTEETRTKLRKPKPLIHSQKLREYRKTDKAKAQLAIAVINNKNRIHTFEDRIANSRAQGCKPFSDITTGKIYEYGRQAATELGLHESAICGVLKGRRSHTKGHVFKYLDSQS